jgi:hypothetical protein
MGGRPASSFRTRRSNPLVDAIRLVVERQPLTNAANARLRPTTAR